MMALYGKLHGGIKITCHNIRRMHGLAASEGQAHTVEVVYSADIKVGYLTNSTN